MDDLAPDEDTASGVDYRSLTKRLKAVGDQAGGAATPLFGSSPEPGSGVRFVGILPWPCLIPGCE